MKLTTLIILLFNCTLLTAQNKYWQQQVNFKIDVQLNDETQTLTGFAKIEYVNHSPDTLRFIWFHLWPNAYRTDRTAFSDQLLENGRTDFYFSNKEDRGYINRLDFRVNNIVAKTEDHPEHIDIIKLLLPQPLPPGAAVNITTPFHIKLPKNFSRGGYSGNTYQVTQWYPKPAVYDQKGWHPLPYLDQGEFYSEFGDYEVLITVPKNYIVLSSGNLQNEDEKKWLKTFTASQDLDSKNSVAKNKTVQFKTAKKKIPATEKITINPVPVQTKSLLYKQTGIHDFAWFAGKTYKVKTDTLQLPSGKIIDLYTAFHLANAHVWEQSIQFLKDAVLYRSRTMGEYPYNTIAAVEADMGFAGGMEYPCITSISPTSSARELESIIQHEVGHNWLQGMLANNERRYPWLDEGINAYYDKRFNRENSRFRTKPTLKKKFIDFNYNDELLLQSFERWKKDQPLNTPSDSLTEANYFLISYTKGAAFMQLLEEKLGREEFDKAMQHYFSTWKQKHVYPENLKTSLEESSGKNLDTIFALLNKKGAITTTEKKKTKLAFLAGTQDHITNTVILSPVAGMNMYDGLMIGAALTNYTLAPSRFQYLLAPMYSTSTRQLNGAARFAYTFYPQSIFQRVTVSLGTMKFNTGITTDTVGRKYIKGFRKIAPSLKLVLNEKNPRSTRERFIQFKTFFFNEDDLKFRRDTFPNGNGYTEIIKFQAARYLNQLQLVAQDTRALYPYRAELIAEQGKGFVRLAFTGNYFFNYAKETGGANIRLFAGKFLYTNRKTANPFLYGLQMSAPKGKNDYTYSNYFIGRNEYPFRSQYQWTVPYQQILIRDGAFKVNTDAQNNIGFSDNWLFALSGTFKIPDNINVLNILPVKIPLKFFAETGTYAEAWGPEPAENKFLFAGGLQVSFLKESINIYIPLVYSKVFREYYKTDFFSNNKNRFLKTISFSIDIQNLSLKKIDRRLPF